MALVLADAGVVVTAAPGTASTSLREALLARPGTTEVPAPGAGPTEGIDAKHATVRQLVAAGLLAVGTARPRRVNAGHVDEADVVLRMDHLETDLRELCGLELPVPPTNVTRRHRAWWQAHGVESRALVEQAHRDDLELFGYRF